MVYRLSQYYLGILVLIDNHLVDTSKKRLFEKKTINLKKMQLNKLKRNIQKRTISTPRRLTLTRNSIKTLSYRDNFCHQSRAAHFNITSKL